MALLLIADDLSISRETLARVLREAGHRVLTASSGEEALERARSEPPDMALLDFNMQGMNGLQTAAGLKAQSTAPLLPVMIISGKVLGANELTEILATADDFVRKPYTPAEVCARVDVWLRVRRVIDSAQHRGAPSIDSGLRSGASAASEGSQRSVGSSGSLAVQSDERRSGPPTATAPMATIDSAQRSGAPSVDSAQRSGAPSIDSAQRSGAPSLDSAQRSGAQSGDERRGMVPVPVPRGRTGAHELVATLPTTGYHTGPVNLNASPSPVPRAVPSQGSQGNGLLEDPGRFRGRPELLRRLEDLWQRGQRESEPFALILVEALEGVSNPQLSGPNAVESPGAVVLRLMGRLVRPGDVLGMLSTTQVALILPRATITGALSAAERLRSELRIQHGRRLLGALVLGLALFPARDVGDAKELLTAADRALQRAQQEGPFSLCVHQNQGYLVRAP